jgi:predicted RNase H-like nuclease (RuvC/YqgF family)
MMELVLVLVVLVLFGYMIGYFYARARVEEEYREKMSKLTDIVNEKNAAIIKIKGDLRVLQRMHKHEGSREVELEEMLEKKTKELQMLKESYAELEKLVKDIQKDFQMIKHDKELLLKELHEKKQLLSNQDNIIMFLEKKIKTLSHEVE